GPHDFDRRQRINCLLKLAEGGLILVDSRQSARPEAVDHECGNTHVVERPGKEPIARVDATTAMHDEHQRNGPGPSGWKAQISLDLLLPLAGRAFERNRGSNFGCSGALAEEDDIGQSGCQAKSHYHLTHSR